MFSTEIIQQLRQPIEKERVKHRKAGGGEVSYISGGDAIDTANRIFGYGGWQYKTLDVKPVLHDGNLKGYMAHVELTVGNNYRGNNVTISEIGFNPIQDVAKPDQHDLSIKGAVTDAMKRCLRVFGDQFGNSLYDKDLVDGQPRRGVAQPAPLPLVHVNQVVNQVLADYRELFDSAVTVEVVTDLYNQALDDCIAAGVSEDDASRAIRPVAVARVNDLKGFKTPLLEEAEEVEEAELATV